MACSIWFITAGLVKKGFMAKGLVDCWGSAAASVVGGVELGVP